MTQITAKEVSELRKQTGLPMMECKKALVESGGDVERAKDFLREQGLKTQETKLSRDTDFGRIGIFSDLESGVGAMIELQCESAPVADHEDTVRFAADLARQLATGPGASTPEELLAQPSPSREGMTLEEQKNDLFNRMREVFRMSRLVRFDGPSGGYAHHAGKPKAALLEVSGGTAEAAKDICMHIVALEPTAVTREDLDPALVEKERELHATTARKEGKPENIIEKMIGGRMKKFYEQAVLSEQKFVKDETQTVGDYAKQNGMELKRFVLWELGKE